MKERELEILERIKTTTKRNILPAENEYERFDAYDDNYIWEIKDRGKYYENILIEFDKFSFNLNYAKIINKYFLYAVAMDDKIYIFNISRLKDYDYKWEWREMPKQTEFQENHKINKFVGYIDIKDCGHTIPIN